MQKDFIITSRRPAFSAEKIEKAIEKAIAVTNTKTADAYQDNTSPCGLPPSASQSNETVAPNYVVATHGQSGEQALIAQELARCTKEFDKEVGKSGIFRVKTANQTMQDAATMPDPKPLWLTLWHEGEVCCLFADSNVGKSIYAVQIATAISATQPVLYFDFELSEKQFQRRYTNDDGKPYVWPDQFYRVDIDPANFSMDNFEEAVIHDMEQVAMEYGAKVLIIDNLSWLCNAAEEAEVAGRLMKALLRLKLQYGWSILVLAHTPKRDMTKGFTQNDLAGSKRFANFVDSAFAIGFSVKGDNIRYIRQIKVRSAELKYGPGNVITVTLGKSGGFLNFTTTGYGPETDHLQAAKHYGKDGGKKSSKKAEEKAAKVRKALQKVYKRKEDAGIGYNDLVKALQKKLKYKSDKTVKNIVKDESNGGLLSKNEDDGLYYYNEG